MTVNKLDFSENEIEIRIPDKGQNNDFDVYGFETKNCCESPLFLDQT